MDNGHVIEKQVDEFSGVDAAVAHQAALDAQHPQNTPVGDIHCPIRLRRSTPAPSAGAYSDTNPIPVAPPVASGVYTGAGSGVSFDPDGVVEASFDPGGFDGGSVGFA